MREVVDRVRTGTGSVAFRRLPGAAPTVVWLGGFNSDMAGTKAEALADWAAEAGRAYVRFDYFGHGASSGAFAEGTITTWRQDALAIIDQMSQGPVILVGSSMGGWLACLAAMARPDRVSGLVLIAPAADMTERLMKPELPPAALRDLETHGVWLRPSEYGEPYPISRALLEDGARWSILPGPIDLQIPIRILQGGADQDVPWRHALELSQALTSQDLIFTLIKDGDHRLSRPQDLARIIAAVEELS